ncbi:unnamed protein product, partial [Iphiclides podalirius]
MFDNERYLPALCNPSPIKPPPPSHGSSTESAPSAAHRPFATHHLLNRQSPASERPPVFASPPPPSFLAPPPPAFSAQRAVAALNNSPTASLAPPHHQTSAIAASRSAAMRTCIGRALARSRSRPSPFAVPLALIRRAPARALYSVFGVDLVRRAREGAAEGEGDRRECDKGDGPSGAPWGTLGQAAAPPPSPRPLTLTPSPRRSSDAASEHATESKR